MKKAVFISFLICSLTVLQAQDVNIPNANFLNALITAGVDTSGDNIIQNAEALAVTSLSIGSLSISNITGIEAFTNLVSFACPINSLTSVDLSHNTLLEYLDVGGNYGLTTLDLSQNTALKNLDIIFTGLTTIDLSNNLLLQSLAANGTVYGTGTLNNKLTSLDVSKNTLLTNLSADMNPHLPRICVNADQYANRVVNWSKDPACVWDTVCTPAVSIIEATAPISSPKIVRCCDVLGNEIDPENSFYKGMIIYFYSDGSIKKVLKIE